MASSRFISSLFLKSALSFSNPFMTIQEAMKWIKSQNEKVHVGVKKIAFSDLDQWSFDKEKGSLCHHSGKFFSIDGIRVNTNWGKVPMWEQPIINQAEVGYLGFITKEFNGVLHFLVQAKIEPGNVNHVQLSPTLQATKSNYTQVHQGKSPAYLEYFVNASPDQVLFDQFQSEQGARFLKKRNRNIIILTKDEVPLLENFKWLTLAQLKVLMRADNIVNMDTRTVISGIPFGSYDSGTVDILTFLNSNNEKSYFEEKVLLSTLVEGNSVHSLDEIINFITRQKNNFELKVEQIPLQNVDHWHIGTHEISHSTGKYFKVIAVEVNIGNREVVKWTQPMIEPCQKGVCAFVCKEINGVLHFAVQAKLECGNFDIIEFAPTVQCLTGDYEKGKGKLPFLDYVLTAEKDRIMFDTIQSEEGGRFYKEQNRNMIVFAGDEIPSELPENYIWMTINQLQLFIRFNNYINIQARSLLAALSFKNETT